MPPRSLAVNRGLCSHPLHSMNASFRVVPRVVLLASRPRRPSPRTLPRRAPRTGRRDRGVDPRRNPQQGRAGARVSWEERKGIVYCQERGRGKWNKIEVVGIKGKDIGYTSGSRVGVRPPRGGRPDPLTSVPYDTGPATRDNQRLDQPRDVPRRLVLPGMDQARASFPKFYNQEVGTVSQDG